MHKQPTMSIHPLQSLAVKVLRAVSGWSGRQYRRELFREALWRIGREREEERRRRAPRGEKAERHRFSLRLVAGKHVITG